MNQKAYNNNNNEIGGNDAYEDDDNNNLNIENDNNHEDEDDPNEEEEEVIQPRRSARIPKPTIRYTAYKHQGYSQIEKKSALDEYNVVEAKVLATIMCQFKERMKTTKIKHGNQYVVTYSLKKGIKEFGKQGKQSVVKERKQLHDRKCFMPVNITTLSPT